MTFEEIYHTVSDMVGDYYNNHDHVPNMIIVPENVYIIMNSYCDYCFNKVALNEFINNGKQTFLGMDIIRVKEGEMKVYERI